MDAGDLLAPGFGLQPPLRLATGKTPHEVFLEVTADRAAEYLCPVCGMLGKAHDFLELTFCHLNLFRHHCHVNARLPWVDYPDHKIKAGKVPWARGGSRFTLLFEQAAMTLSNARPEGLNGIFKAAKARTRGYRNVFIFIIMIYFVHCASNDGCRFNLSKLHPKSVQ